MLYNRHFEVIYKLLCKQGFFSTHRQCCLTFSWIELQMLLRCCLYIIIIILRHILYLVYLCPCLGLNVFMSYLCDLFFIISIIFIMINSIISWIPTHLFFCLYLEHAILFWAITWIKGVNNFQIAKVQPQDAA